MMFGFGCGDGKRVPLSDYDKGFNNGVEVMRQARQEAGELGAGAVKVGTDFRTAFGPIDDSKSPDWNAGFQRGLDAEYER